MSLALLNQERPGSDAGDFESPLKTATSLKLQTQVSMMSYNVQSQQSRVASWLSKNQIQNFKNYTNANQQVKKEINSLRRQAANMLVPLELEA